MQDLIKQMLKELFQIASSEGLKFIRESAVLALVRIVQAVRWLFLLNCTVIILCFLSALSLFHTLYLLAELWDHPVFIWTTPLKFCLTLSVLSIGTLAFIVREKVWVSIFGVDQLVDRFIQDQERSEAAQLQDEIEDIVERMVEAKLNEMTRKVKVKRKAKPKLDDEA